MRADPLPANLAGTFRAEELSGLRLLLWVRLGALLFIGVTFLLLQEIETALLNLGVLVVFAGIGFGQFAVARQLAHPARTGYFTIILDYLLLAFTIFWLNPNFGGPYTPPPQMMFGLGNFSFFLLFVALAALSYAPWQPIWAGLVAAATWYGCYFWARSLPDTVQWPFDELPEPETVWEFISQPYFVSDGAIATEALAALTIGTVLAAVVTRSRRLVAKQMETSRQRANLARYFAPTLVDRLAEHDEVLRTARTQQVAVLFADIVGFTGRTERSDPQAVIELLRAFHRGLEAAVFEHDGTLDKFLGDGIMATFGSPERGPRDAVNALAAARAMLEAVEALNRERALDPPLRIGVGLHYGEVVLGDIGSERRLEYAVLGDVVNVAARLEEMTRRLRCRLAVSREVLDAAAQEDAAAFAELKNGLRPAGEQELRGRDERIAVSVLD